MKNLFFALLSLSLTFMVSDVTASKKAGRAQITEYYTTLGGNPKGRRACAGEGNRIVAGQLYHAGSGGKCVAAKKYCAWGMGNRSNCLFPCRDAAVGSVHKGKKIVSVPRFKCPFGPLKGQWITKLRVSDVGAWIKGGDIDVFKGICAKSKNGLCKQYASDSMIARYGGGGRNFASLKDPLAHIEPTAPNRIEVAEASESTAAR